MSGIVSYGAYIPFHRIQRAEIGRALGVRAADGERAVACYDEDSVTMAVEAARTCLTTVGPNPVRTLCFATTAPRLW